MSGLQLSLCSGTGAVRLGVGATAELALAVAAAAAAKRLAEPAIFSALLPQTEGRREALQARRLARAAFSSVFPKFLKEKRRERKGGALVTPPAHLRGVDGGEKGKAAEPPLLHLLSAVLPVRSDHFR